MPLVLNFNILIPSTVEVSRWDFCELNFSRRDWADREHEAFRSRLTRSRSISTRVAELAYPSRPQKRWVCPCLAMDATEPRLADTMPFRSTPKRFDRLVIFAAPPSMMRRWNPRQMPVAFRDSFPNRRSRRMCSDL